MYADRIIREDIVARWISGGKSNDKNKMAREIIYPRVITQRSLVYAYYISQYKLTESMLGMGALSTGYPCWDGRLRSDLNYNLILNYQGTLPH